MTGHHQQLSSYMYRLAGRFVADRAGFSGAEAALLACVLGAACIVVGNKLASGAATAAGNVDSEIATGAPGQSGPARPPLSWKVPVGEVRLAQKIDQPRPWQYSGGTWRTPNDVQRLRHDIGRPGDVAVPQGEVERLKGDIERPRRDIERPQRDVERVKGDLQRPKKEFQKPNRDFQKPAGVQGPRQDLILHIGLSGNVDAGPGRGAIEHGYVWDVNTGQVRAYDAVEGAGGLGLGIGASVSAGAGVGSLDGFSGKSFSGNIDAADVGVQVDANQDYRGVSGSVGLGANGGGYVGQSDTVVYSKEESLEIFKRDVFLLLFPPLAVSPQR